MGLIESRGLGFRIESLEFGAITNSARNHYGFPHASILHNETADRKTRNVNPRTPFCCACRNG